jgi:1,4-alpha-glucan branching enzyme
MKNKLNKNTKKIVEATSEKIQVKTKKSKAIAKEIEFNFFAPLSKKVLLGGDFNKWKPARTSLKGSKKGVWSTSLSLKPGRYEYRFLIDGKWENDNQRQTELVGNSFGETNNVLIVE